MLYPFKDREDLQNLNELVSQQNQVQVIKLQDNLGEQNYHQKTKKNS